MREVGVYDARTQFLVENKRLPIFGFRIEF